MPFIGLGRRPIQLEGHWVKTSSTRLECFRRNQKCVTCGKVGSIFLLQAHKVGAAHHTNCFIEDCEWCCIAPPPRRGDTPHLNFFHVGKRGGLTLMTQDHIKPKSRGGANKLDNLQTMCVVCNNHKGNDYDSADPKIDLRRVHSGPEWE